MSFSSSLQLDMPLLSSSPNSVSIPVGFSSSLQPLSAIIAIHRTPMVSIPVGFSSSLQQFEEFLAMLPDVKFQSLSGFQARCNGSGNSWVPYRF